MTLPLFGKMDYRIDGDSYEALMAQVPDGGRLFVEIEDTSYFPAGGEMPLMHAPRPVDGPEDYDRIIKSGSYVYWFAFQRGIVSMWEKSRKRPNPLYARRLALTARQFEGLLEQLHDGEVLWGEYYWFCSIDCLSSTLERVPLQSLDDYLRFMNKNIYWRDPSDYTFWALTAEQVEFYQNREQYGYYDPFQEDPAKKARKARKASRRTAPAAFTEHSTVQPTKVSWLEKLSRWAAGFYF